MSRSQVLDVRDAPLLVHVRDGTRWSGRFQFLKAKSVRRELMEGRPLGRTGLSVLRSLRTCYWPPKQRPLARRRQLRAVVSTWLAVTATTTATGTDITEAPWPIPPCPLRLRPPWRGKCGRERAHASTHGISAQRVSLCWMNGNDAA
ncbi:hypothetical protein O3P69_016402 [Scylla paramamosain]|uniref:Uncharacterized protein n=1 Tax=Scylla paramamosain TaxID=85552 RepID=A0AAW0TE85_SCYPA